MKEILQSILVVILLSSLGAAQSTDTPEFIHREFVLRELADGNREARQNEDRLRARVLETQLRDRMNHIALLWRSFVQEYNGKNSFNVRTARELSKAFRELERTECWPKPDRSK